MNNDSDTSAEMDINILDNNDNKIDVTQQNNHEIPKTDINTKKPESSDTDYYLNLLANQDKLNDDSDNKSDASSSLSEIIESEEESDDSESESEESDKEKSSEKSSNSSSKANYHKVSLSPKKSPSPKSSPRRASPRKENIRFEPPKQVESFEVKKELSPQELRMKKIELLRKLSELKAKGYELSKGYNFDSSIEEMEYEFELLKSFANKRNGVKLYKNILLNTVSAVEFLNDKYDPFDFQLTGWSEHMSVEVDSYDEVIEEIYEKYKGTGKKMPAEIKLLMLILASASAFHFSKSTFKNLPGVDKILQNNPDLISKMMNPQKESSQFMTEQEINIERQRKNILEKEKQMRRGQNQQQPVVNNVSSFQNNQFAPVNNNQQINTPPVQGGGIKAPMNVQDILNRLHNSENNNSSDTQDENSSNNDRLVASTSLNSSEKRKGRKKKSIMTIS
jgi:hypothetical protein